MSFPGYERTINIRPTLFLCLGGTGMEIALRVRRRLLEHVWGSDDNPVRLNDLTEFPFAQFIHFDLDAGSREKTDVADPLAELVKFREEENAIYSIDFDKYFRTDKELERYPHIASWFPFPPQKLRELRVDRFKLPAPRAFSRLYFFDKYRASKDMVDMKIRTLLSSVSNRPMSDRLGLELEPGSLRVVVIASTAGGTGSGSFLDMGYLAKWLAKKQLLNAKVDLALMLPTGFSSGTGNKIRPEANTYAALMELEACMGHDLKFVEGWSDIENAALPSRPYDDIFLFNTGNIARKTAKVTDLFDMVGNILFEDFVPSEFSVRKRFIGPHQMRYKIDSFSLPVDAQKYGKMKMMYSKAYSSFGQCSFDSCSSIQRDEENHGKPHGDPLIEALSEMTNSERRAIFQHCLEMAMPWVEANLEGNWTVNPDQYSCAIGVSNPELFEKMFGDEFRSTAPTCTRMIPQKIRFYETTVPGKLICYVELSGMPLLALNQLSSWRDSYDKESTRFPLHIHKDKTLFVHPMAPSSGALARLAEHFKLYIQGVVLGVLKIRTDDPEQRVYCLTVSGEELSIGNERIIRLEGVASVHLVYLQKMVADALDKIISPAQYAGLVALYKYFADHVYPEAIQRKEDGCEVLVAGFGNTMCTMLEQEALKKNSAAGNMDTIGLIRHLKGLREDDDPNRWENFDTLDIWTDEIEGSETDVYENEVWKSHKPKRILKPEFFQSGWLESRLNLGAKEPAESVKLVEFQEVPKVGGPAGSPPPLPSQLQVYVAVNGQQAGPFDMNMLRQIAKSRQLTPDSLVWMEGMGSWEAASKVTAMAGVFGAVPPPLPPPTPPLR